MNLNGDFHAPQPTGIPAIDKRMANTSLALNQCYTPTYIGLEQALQEAARSGQLPADPQLNRAVRQIAEIAVILFSNSDPE